jgi:hypothetical protein
MVRAVVLVTQSDAGSLIGPLKAPCPQALTRFALALKGTSAQPGNGPGRCGTWGLRAPARC